jgi:hypothetical protein
MKVNRRQLRRLIEATINENEERLAKGLTLASALGLTGAELGLGNLLVSLGSEATLIASSYLAAAGMAGVAGYEIGDYINKYLSGKTGSDDEKFINSFKRHAKEMIGELGVKVFGLELNWDTLSDEDYAEKARQKNFKGLKPHEIDDKRLNQLLGMIIVHINFSEDKKVPENVEKLFNNQYLDIEAFGPVIKEKQESFVKSIKSKIDKNKLAKSAKTDTGEDFNFKPSTPEIVNESLSRGSLYRRRYRR